MSAYFVPRRLLWIVCGMLLFVLVQTNRAISAEILPVSSYEVSSHCVIPDSGPWPPCATDGNTPSPSADADCVIPDSGPWPPCATGGSAPAPPANTDCVIPESGPWPPCATGGSTPAPPADVDCAIPDSGPWPPCATGGSAPAPADDNPGSSASGTHIPPATTPLAEDDTRLYSIDDATLMVNQLYRLTFEPHVDGRKCNVSGGVSTTLADWASCRYWTIPNNIEEWIETDLAAGVGDDEQLAQMAYQEEVDALNALEGIVSEVYADVSIGCRTITSSNGRNVYECYKVRLDRNMVRKVLVVTATSLEMTRQAMLNTDF